MKSKLVFIIGICGMVTIAAQDSCSAQTGSLRAMLARPSVADAMADAYGRAVIGDFAKILSDQGDANCRDARKLDKAALNRGAEAILVSYGNTLVTLQSGRASEEGLAEKLDEVAGAGSAAALRSLADQHRIKELQGFYRPRFNDNLVDRIAGALDRYAIINRLFRGNVSPLSGNIGLAVSAAERAVSAENAAKKAFGSDRNLQRLIDLYGSLIDAYEFEMVRSGSLTSPDYEAFKGVEERLQALCLRIGS